jgi:hypothetical protein
MPWEGNLKKTFIFFVIILREQRFKMWIQKKISLRHSETDNENTDP